MEGVIVKKLPKSQTLFEVVLPEEAVQVEMAAAAEMLSQKADIKGFRKGKAPRDVLERHVGTSRLFEEASYSAIDKIYQSLFKEHALHPVGQPSVEIKKCAPGNPLVFSLTIASYPEIILPDYRAIARKALAEKKTVVVKKEEVEETLSHIQKSRRKEVLVARPARKGDLAELDFETRIAGVKLEGGSSRNHPLLLGESKFIPGFEENIFGMTATEEKTFALTVPNDYYQEPLRGKQLDFTVTLNGVYELTLPELDDAFATSLGAFDTMEKLEENIRSGIQKEKEAQETGRARKLFAEEAAGKAIIDVPDVLVDQEVQKMISEMQNTIEQEGADFAGYCVSIKKTKDDLKKDFRAQADTRVRIALILSEIATKENIELDEKEVEAQVEMMFAKYDEAQKTRIDTRLLKEYVSGIMKNEKVFVLLEI